MRIVAKAWQFSINLLQIFGYLPYFDLAVNGMHDSLGLLGPTLFSAITLNSYL